MKKNDIVKISNPQNEAEKTARFVVMEDSSPRGSVSIRMINSNLTIVPIELVHVKYFEICKD